MARKSKIMVKKSIYQMGMATLIASVIWIGIVVYMAIENPIDISVDAEMLKPLTPIMDGEVVDKIVERRQMGENDWITLRRTVNKSTVEIEVEEEESTGSAVAQP